MSKPQPISELDRWFPHGGPCAFCGFHDRRHRLWDAIMARGDRGESPSELSEDYGIAIEAIDAVLRHRPYEKELAKYDE